MNTLELPTTLRSLAPAALLRDQTLKACAQDEAARLQALGSHAAKIAHDLNNLLSPIVMSLEFFRPHLNATGHRALLEIAQKSTARAADLVTQILSFARGATESFQPIDAAALVEEIVAMLKATFPAAIEVEADTEMSADRVLGSSSQLHRALLNLCANARDAMPDGGALKLHVRNVEFKAAETRAARGVRAGRYVMIQISDTGCGIPESIREKIFEPFFTTKGAGQGTGLGLASVRAVVENHGGALNLQTETGKGTTFQILLPAVESGFFERNRREEIRVGAAAN